MTQAAIFGPLFATVLLTFVVWVYMYIRRISFITSNKISSKDLAVPGALAMVDAIEIEVPRARTAKEGTLDGNAISNFPTKARRGFCAGNSALAVFYESSPLVIGHF